jgi:hypothetical protein
MSESRSQQKEIKAGIITHLATSLLDETISLRIAWDDPFYDS